MKHATTSNVVLRAVRDDDLGIFFEQQMDPAANLMVAFTKRDPTDRGVFMAHWAKIRRADDAIIMTIVFDGQVAGNIGKFENEGRTEVGYWIGNKYWGKGIATAALSQFLATITDRPLYAGVAKDNVGSIRVLEKCGFRLVEQTRSFAKARGEEIDELILKVE